MTHDEAIEIMRSAGSRSIPYLQRHLRLSYDESVTICKLLDEPKEVVFLKPFQKGMACPECLKTYSKWHKVCSSCPDDKVREQNRLEDLHLRKIGIYK